MAFFIASGVSPESAVIIFQGEGKQSLDMSADNVTASSALFPSSAKRPVRGKTQPTALRFTESDTGAAIEGFPATPMNHRHKNIKNIAGKKR